MKSIFKSRSAWFGAVVVVGGTLQGLDWYSMFSNPRVGGLVVAVIGGIMIYLRSVTSQPVSVPGITSSQ